MDHHEFDAYEQIAATTGTWMSCSCASWDSFTASPVGHYPALCVGADTDDFGPTVPTAGYRCAYCHSFYFDVPTTPDGNCLCLRCGSGDFYEDNLIV